jgi:hypothetical protein
LTKIIGTSVGAQGASPVEEVIFSQSSKISNPPSFSVQTQRILNPENQTYKPVVKLPPSGPISKMEKSSPEQAKGRMNTTGLKDLQCTDTETKPDKTEPSRVKEDLASPPAGLNPLSAPKVKLPSEKDGQGQNQVGCRGFPNRT